MRTIRLACGISHLKEVDLSRTAKVFGNLQNPVFAKFVAKIKNEMSLIWLDCVRRMKSESKQKKKSPRSNKPTGVNPKSIYFQS